MSSIFSHPHDCLSVIRIIHIEPCVVNVANDDCAHVKCYLKLLVNGVLRPRRVFGPSVLFVHVHARVYNVSSHG